MKRDNKTVSDRKFKGMPVRDAERSFPVQPDAEDIRNAKRGDPERCAYALCLKRYLHTDSVFIYKTIAYVGVLDEKGNRIFERYEIKNSAREYINAFDNGETVSPAGFTLDAPSPSHTLDGILENHKKNANKQKIIGTKTKTWKVAKLKEHSIGFLRNGTGMVHFNAKHDKGKVSTKATDTAS
jgi:hypothetical protein